MKNLFRKEIIQFLGSFTGYLAVITFLVVSGLFLWVFPGNYNIPETGYATLEPFFQLAPWLYLFLVPAITMRLFADEKRSGTVELLLTRPLGDFHLVFAKYLAALFIVAISLLPSLVYFFSVYRLAIPVGNMDMGSSRGAFAGLFFLASVYIAIGIFCSVLTDNQLVAFILSMLISFLFFLGFGLIGGSGIPYFLEKTIRSLSINDHYLSLSRGVIDVRDVIYFLAMTWFFLLLTTVFLRKERRTIKRIWKKMVIPAAVIILFFILSENLRFRIDLTAEKKYSLAEVSKQVARSLDEPVSIELFLDGKLPPGFLKLQQAIEDKVRDISRYSDKPVRMIVSDPYSAVPANLRSEFFGELAGRGVKPTELRQRTSQGTITTLIFPGAIVTKGDKSAGVSFLKNDPGLNHEINLNHSVESIEYELISALRRVMSKEKLRLIFLQGNGESDPDELFDISTSLSGTFQTGFLTPAELPSGKDTPAIIVISNPTIPFSEVDKFAIDQSLMKGSRLLCLINPVNVSLDSLSQGYMTLAFPRDLNLSDLLFHYGIRINSDLLQDVLCARILVNTSLSGDQPKFTPQPWYYSPLLTPSDNHPVSRNLNPVSSEFVSSVDTVANPGKVKTTLLLTTSRYSRIVRIPAEVSLESINTPPARELFTRSYIPAGVLLEGSFSSGFRNRILDFQGYSASQIITESNETRMMVFSAGTLMTNKVRSVAGQQPETLPLGFDRVTMQTYGNKEFFMNAINYLTDDQGIMQLRNTSVKLRLLDKVKLREKGRWWKVLNSTLPSAIIVAFGLTFYLLRKRKNSVYNS